MNKRILLILLMGVFTSNVLFSQSVLSEDRYWDNEGTGTEWMTLNNWGDDMLPAFNDDVHINNNLSATVTLGGTTSFEVESIAIGADGDNSGKSQLVPPVMYLNTSGNLTIGNGYTMTVSKGGHEGSNCVRIEGVSGNESSLIINGVLNINKVNPSGDGLDINPFTSVTVGSTGDLNITAKASHGIEISDDLTNSGTIDIIANSSCGDGIHFSGPLPGSKITNNISGVITINGNGHMDYGLDLNSSFQFDNFGTLIISGTNDEILNGSVNFNNYGTFGGDGTVNASNFDAGGLGATISPGTVTTPIGKLTFLNTINLSNVGLDIDVNSGSSYDQIEIINGTINIDNASLNIFGSYAPQAGDNLIILNNTTGNAIIGTFSGLPEGESLFINGVEMTISYIGGDGNDITASTVVPLPVELISFNGYAEERSNLLNWRTASEENTMVFILERSLDGARDFEEISRINAVGFSTTLQSYEAEDNNPVSLAYYRLRIVDFDGTFEFSDIIAVERSKSEIDSVEVYPVPAEEEVTVLIHSQSESKAIMILSDFLGRKIKEERVVLKPGINRFALNWDEHESTFYYLTIDNGKEKIAKKILRASKD